MSISKALQDLADRCRAELRTANVRATARAIGVHYQHLLKFRDGTAGLSAENIDKLAKHLGLRVTVKIDKKSEPTP